MTGKLFGPILLGLLTLADDAQALPVFPGAEGFGIETVAGSGRHLNPPQTRVYKVTSLADAGPGTLRECMEASVPRTCVFEISGYIDLASRISVRSPYLTVAGHTAPNPGIQVRGSTITIQTSNVLIQHIGVRPGDNPNGPDPGSRDAINIWKGSGATENIILDHVSLTWAIDENFSTYLGPISNVTVSNSIVSEALCDSIHPENDPCHSMGMLIDKGGRAFSIHDNLLAHNNDRNIRMKDDIEMEFGNNVVYNWGGTTGWNQFNMVSASSSVGNRVNFFGNYYKAGVNSPKYPAIYNSTSVPTSTKVWVSHNVHSAKRPSDTGDEWLVSSLPSSMRALSPAFRRSSVPLTLPGDTSLYVALNAGARHWSRYAADSRIVTEMLSGTGTIKDCVSGCARNAGGWPVVTRSVRPLDLPSNPTADDNGDGYTNLENYLFEFLNDGQFDRSVPPTPTFTPIQTQLPPPTTTPTAIPTLTPLAPATSTPSQAVPAGYIGCTIAAGGRDTDIIERPVTVTLTEPSSELTRGDFFVENGVRNSLVSQGALPAAVFVLKVSPLSAGTRSTVTVTLPEAKTQGISGKPNVRCSTSVHFGGAVQATPSPTATRVPSTPTPTKTPTPTPTAAMCWLPCR